MPGGEGVFWEVGGWELVEKPGGRRTRREWAGGRERRREKERKR